MNPQQTQTMSLHSVLDTIACPRPLDRRHLVELLAGQLWRLESVLWVHTMAPLYLGPLLHWGGLTDYLCFLV